MPALARVDRFRTVKAEELKLLAEMVTVVYAFVHSVPADTVVTEKLIDDFNVEKARSSRPVEFDKNRAMVITSRAGERDNVTMAEFMTELFVVNQLDHPLATMHRFLRARKMNLKPAFCMGMKTLLWRCQFNLSSIIRTGNEIPDELLFSGESFLYNTCKQGLPVVYINTSMHDKNRFDIKTTTAHSAYMFEAAHLLITGQHETSNVVFNLTGFGLSNMDWPILKFLINVLQNYYPETLHRCFIVNAPFVFQGLWKMIQPLLDPVVASKIKLIKSAELEQYIPRENIPFPLNTAKDAFRPKAVPYTPAIMSQFKTEQALLGDRLQKFRDESVKVAQHFSNWASSVLTNKEGTNGFAHPYDTALDEHVLLPYRQAWVQLDKSMRSPNWLQISGVVNIDPVSTHISVDWEKLRT